MAGPEAATFNERCTCLRQELANVVGQINQLNDKALWKACEYLGGKQGEQPVPDDDLVSTIHKCREIMFAIAHQVGFELNRGLKNDCSNFQQCKEFVQVLEKEQIGMVKYCTDYVDQAITSARKTIASGCSITPEKMSNLTKRIQVLHRIMWILREDPVQRQSGLVEDNESVFSADMTESYLQRQADLDEEEDFSPAAVSPPPPRQRHEVGIPQQANQEIVEALPSPRPRHEFDIPQQANQEKYLTPYPRQRDVVSIAQQANQEIVEAPPSPRLRDEAEIPQQAIQEIPERPPPPRQRDEVRNPQQANPEVNEVAVNHHQTPTQGHIIVICAAIFIFIPIVTAVMWNCFYPTQKIETTQPAKVQPSLDMPEKKTGGPIKPVALSPDSLVPKSLLCHFHPGTSDLSSTEAQPIVPSAGHWEIEESAGWREVDGNLYPPVPGLYRIGLTFRQVGQGGIEILILRVDSTGLLLNQYAVMVGRTVEDKELAVEVKNIRFGIDEGLSVWGWRRNHDAIESFKLNGKWVGD